MIPLCAGATMDGMPDRDRQMREILAGIRMIPEEMREDRRRAEEDRKRADEDRKRADERFEEIYRQAAEEWRETAEDRRRAEQDRKDFRRAILVVGKVGVDIRAAIKEMRHSLDGLRGAVGENTSVLRRIDRRLGAGGNGRRR